MKDDAEILAIAFHLNCDPGRPETWPMNTIMKLSEIKKTLGEKSFLEELSRLMTAPRGNPQTEILAELRAIRKLLEAK